MSTKGCKSLKTQIIISIHKSDFRLCKEILMAAVSLRCFLWSQKYQQLPIYTIKDERKEQRALGSQNNTIHFVTEFILLGFSNQGEMQAFFFSSILIVYLLTLLGNGAIVCAVKWDRRLHTPMYIFLGNFAFLEIWTVVCTGLCPCSFHRTSLLYLQLNDYLRALPLHLGILHSSTQSCASCSFWCSLVIMNKSQASTVTYFVLLGFPGPWKIQISLFSLILLVYMITLTGNMAIICAVKWNHKLHTPMYMFLANFSFLEIWYVTCTVPNMLVNFLSKTKIMSFSGCFTQFYFFFSLGTTECFFLCAMAYDRYLAICYPLHYPSVMTRQFCSGLVSLCWVIGFFGYLIPIFFISQLSFCGPNIIDHFLCDVDPLMALSCTPTAIIKHVFYSISTLIIVLTGLYILGSYTLVLRAVLRVPSSDGRQKAFSTCGSHLLVVSLFYGTIMVMYVIPSSSNSVAMQKIITLIYSVVTPALNPFIYSLRNKDMKYALHHVFCGKRIMQNS
ncbi:hypothetical protein STEG23_021757 [Scotinomys teguina]